VFGQDYVDECPEANGFFADAVQCDRYYECKNGQIIDNTCEDGLVFEESSIGFAKCSFPFSVDCNGRPELQQARPSGVCPRRNGYFPHENPEVCDQFYFCVDGVANKITCPESLIFNPKTGQCAFSDQVDRPGCSSSEFFQFTCPNNPEARHAHPRYPDPTDCQYFYLCLNGVDARRNGCTVGLVFNAATSSCDRQSNLEANDPCRNWYNETTLEALTAATRPPQGLGGGVAIDTSDRKRVQVVRRKQRPSIAAAGTRQQQRPDPSAAAALAASGGNRVSINPDLRAALAGQEPPQRSRVRVQPPASVFGQQPQQSAPVDNTPRGPPQFSLSDADAIQRFRDQNQFVPQSSGTAGGGRLTVLSGNSPPQQLQTQRARPSQAVNTNSFQQFDQQLPSSPSSNAADETSNFGDRNRFRSRRPPQFQSVSRETAPTETAAPQRSSGTGLRDRTRPPTRGGSNFRQRNRSRQRGSVSRTQSQSSQISFGDQQQDEFSNFPTFDAVRQ